MLRVTSIVIGQYKLCLMLCYFQYDSIILHTQFANSNYNKKRYMFAEINIRLKFQPLCNFANSLLAINN